MMLLWDEIISSVFFYFNTQTVKKSVEQLGKHFKKDPPALASGTSVTNTKMLLNFEIRLLIPTGFGIYIKSITWGN